MSTDSSKTFKIWEIIAKFSIYILVFLLPIFFLPWTTSVLDFNKQTLLICLVFLSLFLSLLKILISRKFSFNLSLSHVAVIVLFLVYFFATIFSLWHYGSFWGWPQHTSDNLLNLICFVLLYFLIVNIFSKKEIFYLMTILVFSGFLVMLFGIFQLFGKYLVPLDFTKISSFNTIGSVNTLGVFAAVLLPLIIVLIINTKKFLRVIFIITALINAALLALVNFSLVWWLVIIGSALLVILGMQKSDFFDSRWIVLPMFFLALSLLFVFFKFQVPGSARPIEVFLSQRVSFDIAREVLKEKPLFGTGPGTFIYDFSKYRKNILNEGPFWNMRFENPGSKIFNILSTAGIFGGLAILFLIGFFIFLGIKSLFKKTEGSKATTSVKGTKIEIPIITVMSEDKKIEGRLWLLGLGIFVSFIVFNIGYFLYSSNITLDFVYFLLIGGFIALISAQKEFLLKPSSLATLIVTFAFTLVFIFSLGLFILQGQRYVAEVNYLQAIEAWQQQKSDEGLRHLERAAILNQKADLYWRELSQVYLRKVNEEAIRKDLPQDTINQRIQLLVTSAINSAKRATDLNPTNVANWSIRGFIYQNLIGIVEGVDDWATKSYDEAASLEPNNPYFTTQKGIVLLRKSTFLPQDKTEEKEQILSQAKEQLEKAISIKSDYSPARFQLAMVYQAQGKTQETIKALEEAKNSAPSDVGLAFQIGLLYYQNKDYQKAQEELERAVGIDPNYANALYFLGLTYDQQGQKTKAIEKFKKVAELNPDNSEVKKILENLKAGKKALEEIAQEVPPQTPIEETPPERLEKK